MPAPSSPEEGLQAASEAGDVKGLVGLLDEYANDVDFVQAACDALFNLLQSSPSTARDFVSRRGIEVLSGAMLQHPEHPEVQQDGCALLWRTAELAGSFGAKGIVDRGGLTALMAVLSNFPEGSHPHEAASLGLMVLEDNHLISFDEDPSASAKPLAKGKQARSTRSPGRAFASFVARPEPRRSTPAVAR
mmetsp:Transcript_27358/g.41353  ORF Transcript_27358/g.41353 Transcript_27358/m.41353 type:complete len:190 (-) Transcript_27358:133-702(-)